MIFFSFKKVSIIFHGTKVKEQLDKIIGMSMKDFMRYQTCSTNEVKAVQMNHDNDL